MKSDRTSIVISCTTEFKQFVVDFAKLNHMTIAEAGRHLIRIGLEVESKKKK